MLSIKREIKPISSILKALESYDGCEIDVRLTKDRVLVLTHDVRYDGHKVIKANYRDLKNMRTLRELLDHSLTIKLINREGKTLWIEAKEDTTKSFRKDLTLCQDFAHKLKEECANSELPLEKLRIISFCPEILKHIEGIRTLRIVPYLWMATDWFIPHYNHKTIVQMFISLRQHMHKTKQMGIDGLLFSKLFLRGFFSRFQPSLEEIRSWATEDFLLGTEAQTLEEEKAFKDLIVFTDYRGEREKSRGENAKSLICHRGI